MRSAAKSIPYLETVTMKPCLLVILALFCASASAQQQSGNIYVATTGSDSNPGTLAKPFATFQRASRPRGRRRDEKP